MNLVCRSAHNEQAHKLVLGRNAEAGIGALAVGQNSIDAQPQTQRNRLRSLPAYNADADIELAWRERRLGKLQTPACSFGRGFLRFSEIVMLGDQREQCA